MPMPILLPSHAPLRRLATGGASIYASRLCPRRPLDVRARVLTHGDAGERVVVTHGRTVDLSRSGAGVTLSGELASGAEVLLCLTLPEGGDQLCLHAVIARRRGFRVGLKFVRITAEQRLLLRKVCHI